MLQYRAAAFFQRAYAPEISMGLNTAEEYTDVYGDTQSKNATKQVETAEAEVVTDEQKQAAANLFD